MNKEDLNNNRILIKVSQDVSVVVPKENFSFCPRDCPVCGLSIGDTDSANTYLKHRACKSCYLNWGEARKEEWANGWRPTEEQVKEVYHKDNTAPTVDISFSKYN